MLFTVPSSRCILDTVSFAMNVYFSGYWACGSVKDVLPATNTNAEINPLQNNDKGW